MERMTEISLAILATLGFIGWLGGGRKWAFHSMLSAVVSAGLGFAGILLYSYGTERATEHRTQTIRDCAIAKVARAACVPGGAGGPWSNICPLYVLSANHTAQQEAAAIAAAEYECTGEIDPKQKSLYEQINQYRHDHGIKEPASPESVPVPPGSISVPFHRTAGGEISYEVLAKEAGSIGETLGPKACAARVRKSYPRTYDDMDDATLTKKVLAKYPGYCDVSTSPPDFIPDIEGIR